ncbi:MAG: STAS domain-containing protein [Desulfobacterales bacterium]|nr:STAS domain-containing protein [Desulfobacterales bacterium]
MSAKNFSRRRDKHGTYCLRGELSIHELEDLRVFLEKTLKPGQEHTISLAGVRFIDTAALQLLIAFKKHLEPEGKLRISAISDELEHILSLSGFKTTLM